MEIYKLPRDVRHLKFKGAMQMSEKVGRLGRGLQRLDLTSHDNENVSGNRVPLDDLGHDQKKDMTSSIT